MKKFLALGTECTQYLKVAKASEGESFVPIFGCFAPSFPVYLTSFSSPC
jgi:hypothetical protein